MFRSAILRYPTRIKPSTATASGKRDAIPEAPVNDSKRYLCRGVIDGSHLLSKRMSCAHQFNGQMTTNAMDRQVENRPKDLVSKKKIRDLISRKRWWQLSPFGQRYVRGRVPDVGVDFTIMSYNILAQELLECHMYLYPHCKKEFLEWNYRFENLMNEISGHFADVVCLQEVQENHLNDHIKPFMKQMGYKFIYKKRSGDKTDGCAIFFKSEVFALVAFKAVEYKKDNVAILDRDNVGVIVLLRPRDENFRDARLCVATTHLLYNPRRGDIKLSQIRLLIAEIGKLMNSCTAKGLQIYSPVILCGDMNCEPFSPLYKFICCGEISCEGMMSGNVSGQQKGLNKGSIITVDALDLTDAGVNSETQYIKTKANNKAGGLVKPRAGPSGNNFVNVSQPSSSRCQPDSCNSWEMATASINYCSMTFSDAIAYEPPQNWHMKCSFSHPFHFHSVYRNIHDIPDHDEITTHTENSMSAVDFIFYNLKSKRCLKSHGECTNHVSRSEGELKLIGQYKLPCPKDIRDIGGLPNAHLSSDHLCLLSRFLLTRKR